MSTTTLKLDWDDDTIGIVRIACLAVAEIYESKGHLPGDWNIKDAARLREAVRDINGYVESREEVKRAIAVDMLTRPADDDGHRRWP